MGRPDPDTIELPDIEDNEKAKLKPKTEEHEAAPKVSLFALFRYSTPFEKVLILLACAFSSLTGTAAPLSVLLLGDLLSQVGDSVAGNGKSVVATTHHLVLTLVWIGLGVLFVSYASNALWQWTGENQARRIRHLYVYSILRQDIGWFDQMSSTHGSVITRLASDIDLIAKGLGPKNGMAFFIIGQFICGFVIAFVRGWELAIVTLAAIPAMFIITTLISLLTNKREARARDYYAQAGSLAEQSIHGVRTVHAFNLQARFSALYDAKLGKSRNIELVNAIWNGFGTGGFMLSLYCLFALAFWWGAKLVIRGKMDGADVLVTFFSLLLGAFDLGDLPGPLNASSNARIAAARIYDTIQRRPVIDSANELNDGIELRAGEFEPTVELQSVVFSYPTRKTTPVLKGVNLKIEKGKTIALIGASGSGKSTIIGLTQRWYDVDFGTVLIGGHPITSLSVPSLRRHIGFVGQEPSLFNLSVRDNILLGMPDAASASAVTQAELERVCKMAQAHDFIMQMPEGYESNVGEHGGTLSGGQKQRIAIARALIKRPEILLMDEATSALDTTSERLVIAALEEYNRTAETPCTIIMVAHRLSTIRNADVIVFFEKGEIKEIGGHDELVAKGQEGYYHRALQMQRLNALEGAETPNTPMTPNTAVHGGSSEALALDAEKHREELDEALRHTATRTLPERKTTRRDTVGSVVADVMLPMAARDDDEELVKRERHPIRTVLGMLKPQWPKIFAGLTTSLITGGINPIFGYVFSHLIILLITTTGEAIAPGPLSGANLYAFLHVMLGLAAFITVTITNIALHKSGANATFLFRTGMFKSMLRQEMGFFDEQDHSVGALTARLATEPRAVASLITENLSGLSQLVGALVTGTTIIFVFSWELTLFNLTLLPMLIIGQFYEGYMAKGAGDSALAKSNGETAQVVTEAVKEIRTVTALGRQQYFIDRFDEIAKGPHRMAQRQALLGSVGFSFAQAYRLFSYALGIAVGAHLLDDKRISFYDMFAVLMVLILTGSEIGHSSALASELTETRETCAKILALLHRSPEIPHDAPGINPKHLTGEFRFKNVAFSYPTRPDRPVFSGKFNLRGEAHKTVALVGPSGCGKSTVIGMLERWYNRSGGVVSVDGTPIEEFSVMGLRKELALVGQEPVLFDMTIRENLLWGSDDENVTQAELDNACKRANAYDFIQGLADKYDTRVGDKGSQMSGGQKQRIAIARALIRKPKILLLDEATSALDSESEAIVQAALDEAASSQTTVTIAHRLSTIQNADLIAVVQGGRVVDQGTHQELLRRGGLYAELARQQQS